MLVKPPLQLERHFYPVINIAADPEYKQKSGHAPQASLNVKLNKMQLKDNPLHWVVEEDIAVTPEEKEAIPYKLTLKVVGHFIVSESFDQTKVSELIEVTGGSMLFSAAREFILMLTARGPWPPITLPTVRIVPDEPKAQAPVEKKKPKLKRKKS
jgi:preprotein translocase subunit SecB